MQPSTRHESGTNPFIEIMHVSMAFWAMVTALLTPHAIGSFMNVHSTESAFASLLLNLHEIFMPWTFIRILSIS
jgi:hypothetical protein